MGKQKGDSAGKVFMREAARAAPWGFMIIIVAVLCLGFINYTGTKLITYAQENAARTIRQLAADPYIVGGIKTNIKEGIEFTLTKASWEMRGILRDTEFKENIKELIGFTVATAGRESGTVLPDQESDQNAE
jgi:hypothetical protein